jgi:putative membrane protein
VLWFKAFHVIFVVTWFSGLFYLPRLFVYHAMAEDIVSIQRFKIMEKKLFYAILLPSAVLATFFGIMVLTYAFSGYMRQPWMHIKLALVVLLWLYTLVCGKYVQNFAKDRNPYSAVYFRFFNEVPALLLIAITLLVIVKPSL